MSPGLRGGPCSAAGALAIYLFAVVTVAGAATWPVHALLAAAGFEDLPLHRIAFRLTELLAVLALIPALRLTGGAGRAAWGYRGGGWLAELAIGFACGIASLGAFALLLLATGLRVGRPDLVLDPGWLAAVVAGGIGTAASVSLIEETWLRGALHTLLERAGGALAAIGCTAALYAALHFVRPPVMPVAAAADPLIGFVLLGGSFERYADPQIAGPLLALVAVGVLLGLVRRHTGRIAACIGLHAGWVVAIRVLKKTTHMTAEQTYLPLIDGYDGVIGWLAFAWFALLSAAFWRLVRPGRGAGA